MKNNFPSLLLGSAWLLTAIVLAWFGWYTHHTYNEAHEKRLNDISIEAVRGEIVHYDEILTMSARMAATTGDPRWEQRHKEIKILLDGAIQRALNLASEEYSQQASVLTDIAHRKLVDMEYRAFDLIHQGRLDEAKTILYGEEYLMQKRSYGLGMARFPITRFPNLRLVELQGKILHLDEVLTMSSRMAAFTGDAKWETRYHQFVPLLDDAIRESIDLAPSVAGSEAAEQTNQANQKLVEMELKAFDLIHQGLLDEARTILFSQLYEEQKQNYASGMAQFIAELNNMSESITRSEYQKVLWNIIAAFLAIVILLIGWLYVLRFLKIWHEVQKQTENALRNLANQLQVAREEERTRISREIHDQLGQALTFFKMDMAWMLRQLLPEQKDLQVRIRNDLTLMDETLQVMRRISHDLRPAMLDDFGLVATIEHQVEEFNQRMDSISYCELELNTGDIGLDNKRDTVLFRILQEALTNVARYAQADKVKVTLSTLDLQLVLSIEDDGTGIRKERRRHSTSIGIIGMRERCEAIGGEFQIETIDGGGTRVICMVPFSTAAGID